MPYFWNNCMITVENINLYFENLQSHHGNTVIYWSDRMIEMFPYRTETFINGLINDSLYLELCKKFHNNNIDCEIEKLYIISEFHEATFAHGLNNFCRKIEKYPKNVPIIVTNFSNYMLEMYDYLRKEGYNILNFETISLLILNKKLNIKKLYIDESNSLYTQCKKHDFSYIRDVIKKTGVVFLKKDAELGKNRQLLNVKDVELLFIKYGFVIVDKFSDLSFYEKKMYMNNFKNIFIEAGSGLINSFLINNPNGVNIFNMQSPSYDASYIYSEIENVNIINLEFGQLATDSELYKKEHPDNEPWRMDLIKLEEKLKKLTLLEILC